MELNSLIAHLQNNQNNNVDFYTPSGLHVYFKEPLDNTDIDVELVISKLESKVPAHILSCVEMIVVGDFEEFHERSISAFYDSGAIYVSNLQDSEEDIYDDLVHEYAHAVEEQYGHFIYGDRKIYNEFLRKRRHLHDILWKMGFKAPMSFYEDVEYNQDFDDFLYRKVGYLTLDNALRGLFLSSYAATSLREYFATAFTDFYMVPDHKFLKSISPEVYKKIFLIQDAEKLDF
jgi:hypothetical protein